MFVVFLLLSDVVCGSDIEYCKAIRLPRVKSEHYGIKLTKAIVLFRTKEPNSRLNSLTYNQGRKSWGRRGGQVPPTYEVGGRKI